MRLITIFRITGFLEGLSYLLLLGVGVPLKYTAGNESWVKALGLPHGILFMAFLILLFVYGTEKKWKASHYISGFLASILPFGTFYFDYKLLKKETV
ncbi:MAG: DUF3817 domain-containing protein [Bacteroidota bacterium]